MEYYYALEGKKHGPVTKDELRELIRTKKIDSKTLIWKQGMTEWKELGAIAKRKAPNEEVAVPVAPAREDLMTCSECGKSFSKENMIYLQGSMVCASCKPLFVQKMKEGVDSTGSYFSDQYGSLEKGISGNYALDIGAVMSEAWALVKGSKLIFVGAVLCMYGISFGISIMFSMISIPLMMLFQNAGGPETLSFNLALGIQLLSQLISTVVSYVMMAGMIIIGTRRSLNLPVPFSIVFKYFNRSLSILGLYLLMMLLVLVGFLLLVIPGIYLMIAYSLALPLMVEKNLGPWQALEASRKAITKNWFSIFALGLIMGLIVMFSAIFLLIPLIWTGPFALLAYGILYRQVFGYDGG